MLVRKLSSHTLDLLRTPLGRSGLARTKEWRSLVAGIAGLYAAYALDQAGHDVAVFEALTSQGERLRTEHFASGSHGELGAMRMPKVHKGVEH